MFDKGQTVYVRNLVGVYRVENSWLVSGTRKRRYRCMGIPSTGAMLDSTDAYGDQLKVAELPPEPVKEELALVEEPTKAEDPDIAIARQQSKCADCGKSWGQHHIECPQLNPPSEPHENTEEIEIVLQEGDVDARESLMPRKLRRFFAQAPLRLDHILYEATFKAVGDRKITDLDVGSPYKVVVTQETNGFALWIGIVEEEGGDVSVEYQLEIFYPMRRPTETRTAALEHAVLLAHGYERSKLADLDIMLLSI